MSNDTPGRLRDQKFEKPIFQVRFETIFPPPHPGKPAEPADRVILSPPEPYRGAVGGDNTPDMESKVFNDTPGRLREQKSEKPILYQRKMR